MLEEVEILIDTHHLNQFLGTKSSQFMKKVIAHQGSLELRLFNKTWKSLNWSPKTIEMIWEIQENVLGVGRKRKYSSQKQEFGL